MKRTEAFTPVDAKVGLTTDGKILKFATLEDYEKAVDHEQAALQEEMLKAIKHVRFKNYATLEEVAEVTVDKSKGQEMDDFLAQLLNVDGAVQIEEHIYKVDLAKEKVFVIKAEDRAKHYQDLIHGNTSNKAVMEYSTDDDVLYAVRDGINEKCGGIDGGEYVTDVVDFGNEYRCQGSVKYFRAGIYFRTTARFIPLITGVIYTELEIKGPQAWAKKRPCNSGDVITANAGVVKAGYTQQLWELYGNTRNLNGYYLFARVKCTFNGVTKYSNWAGRNINSPY